MTYLNHLDGKRHELIGDIDSVTADAVISKYGNTQCPCFYLDGVLKESMS